MNGAMAVYATLVMVLGIMGYRRRADIRELNIASRSIGWIPGGFSVAATWIWAPALFVASQRAYLEGILGLSWFLVPNVICLFLFAYIAKRSQRFGEAQSLSALMGSVYCSRRLEVIYNVELLMLAACSTGVQLLAGGAVLSALTGFPFWTLTVGLAALALSYSMLGGIRASVTTDVLQMGLMMVAVAVALMHFVPGSAPVWGGVRGLSVNFFSPDNWGLFVAFGLTTSIGLLSGPIGDQTFWQRAFSIEPGHVGKAFCLGAAIFATVPLGMGLLGAIAAGSGFEAANPEMVGLEFVMAFAPRFIGVLFVLCIISGLSSTLDSNMCAISSLVTNMSRKTGTPVWGRGAMVALALAGIGIANIPGMQIFWLFLLYGVLRSTVAFPTALTMIRGGVFTEASMFKGILLGLAIGLPIYTFGAIYKITPMVIGGTLIAVLLPLASLKARK